MIRRPPRSTLSSSSAASDVYKRQAALTVIGLWGARPPAWRWPFIAMCLLYPNTLWLVLSGNPDIWGVALVALATRWPASSAWIVLQPTLAPLGVLGMRTRRWWLVVAALALVS